MEFALRTAIGYITISMELNRIILVEFGGNVGKNPTLENDAFQENISFQFNEYFAGKLKVFDLPLQYNGTPFQMKVWRYLQTIPYGQTVSYQAVAKAIGHPKSARTVGTACKHNPIPIIIPCHRIISSTGEIGEYAGGKRRKEALLRLETATSLV
ncbi:methylated-DNA--[protein]-cysteine S-methyltransferase [Candidatus Woesebacteria bacterium]|nr:methylated-DNA--[protein]-cysteine S-methyltransferase [Candidatus Woesebacteria bacterium]